MTILRKNLNTRSLINAVVLGLTVSFVLSLVLMFVGALTKIRDASKTWESADTSVIVSTAMAAEPIMEMPAPAAPIVIGADSGLDEFRLEPDRCCINHY
jgi:hypothetical protein